MATYRTSGGLDDVSLEDGDRGFVGVNQREQPNQLRAGEVVESLNGRIDGYWQPRRGIELKSGQLSTSALPLRLPFFVTDSALTVTGAVRASDVVTLTVGGGHGLNYGSYASAVIDPAGSNNAFKVTAVATGESETDISVEVSTNPENGDAYPGIDDILIETSGRAINVVVGERSGKKYLTVSNIAADPSANGSYILAVEGSDTVNWEWTTDGNPMGGSWGSGGTRYAIFGTIDPSENQSTFSLQKEDGTQISFPGIPNVFDNFPPFRKALWPDDTRLSLADGADRPIVITAVKASAEEVIDAINADSTASALVTASASGTGTGAVDDVAATNLTGGWGNVAYMTIGDPSNATAPLTGTDNVVAGAYEMTVTGDTTMTFANVGADETLTVDGTYGYLSATLDDGAVSNVFGVCSFSDPVNDLDESAILAVNTSAKKISLDTYAVTDLPYPSGSTVSGRVSLLQAFDRVYLFRDGSQTWEWIPQGRSVSASDYTSATGVVSVTLEGHGLTAGDSVTVADIGFATTDPNGTHTVSTVADADTFEYVIATGGGDETYTAATGKVTASGFTKVIGGAYTQKQSFSIAGTAAAASSGTVTLTVSSNTTFEGGDRLQIHSTDVPELLPLVGNVYEVTAATSTTIAFVANVGDFTGASGEYVTFGGRASQDGGFIHMPAPPWAVYFQRRLWCPYWYENGGTAASPTYTDRNLRDDIVVSDILDSNTFDRVFNQFRTTGGTADYLVGMQPFYNDNIIMLNRNSLHLLTGTQGSLADTVMREMTREVGCLARKSVAAQGNQIFFLSDSGVYALSFIDEYNLRGTEEPLSKSIQPYIDRINQSLAGNSVGVYFDNRYFLAVPLDSSEGVGDAKGNNTILVYNQLNKAWESIDTIADGEFLIEDFVIGQSGDRNRLYLVNQAGGLHLANALTDGSDTYSLDVLGNSSQAGINYEFKSRGYDLGSFGRKKFRNAQVQLKSDDDHASDVSFRFNSEDPDTSDFEVTDIASLLDTAIGLPGQLAAGEAANFRFRLGNPRGFYGQLTIRRKIVGSQAVGRPKLTSIKLEATETNRNTITQY